MIVIVNDGQTCWGADHSELKAAMEAHGWKRDDDGFWVEPDHDDDNEFNNPYLKLCNAVLAIDGFYPDDFPRDTEGCARLILRPDRDGRWEFCER